MSLCHDSIAQDEEFCNPLRDFRRFDASDYWTILYQRLRNESASFFKELSCSAAREVCNRWKNRYRDITPYDINRVRLKGQTGEDYINASFVCIPQVKSRRYILTQGPMKETSGHFWLMILENKCPMIVMLNRIFEKGVMRCHPYFPYGGSSSCLDFSDVGIRVNLESEISTSLFTRRIFNVTTFKSSEESHRVLQMHYTSWPDFGVPSSPSGMLNFLWAVRATGFPDQSVEDPVVVHCSAGVGRSGAFLLIDLALCQIEQRESMNGVDLAQLFVALRQCRMGIIQTAEQLRFCYLAVAHGGQLLLDTPKAERHCIQFQSDPNEENPTSSDSSSSLSCPDYATSPDEPLDLNFDEQSDGESVENVSEEPMSCFLRQPDAFYGAHSNLARNVNRQILAESSGNIVRDRSNNAVSPGNSMPLYPLPSRSSSDEIGTNMDEGASSSVVDLPVAEDSDLLYLTAVAEACRRREARRERQQRMRERIAAAREHMRRSDLERKRWLPNGLMRRLRRFYTETGFVHSPFGAVVVSSILAMTTVALGLVVYNFWTVR